MSTPQVLFDFCAHIGLILHHLATLSQYKTRQADGKPIHIQTDKPPLTSHRRSKNKIDGVLEMVPTFEATVIRVIQEHESPPFGGAVAHPTATVVYDTCYHLLRKRSCMTVHRFAWTS